MEVRKEIQTVKVTQSISLRETHKILLDRTLTASYSYTIALQTTKNSTISTPPLAALSNPPPTIEKQETITIKLPTG